MTNKTLPPIKGFIQQSSTHWPGRVCAVVSLPYCNLRCPYCYSHALVLRPDTLESFDLDLILNSLKQSKERIYGICITGGEPTMHRSLPPMLKKIHEAGFKTKLHTNGTQPEILEYLIRENLLDHVSLDVKAPLNEAAYERCAGVYVPTSLIRGAISVIMASDISSNFRCTIAPPLLSETEICDLAEELKTLQRKGRSGGVLSLTLQDINPADPLDPAFKGVKPFGKATLSRLQDEVDRLVG